MTIKIEISQSVQSQIFRRAELFALVKAKSKNIHELLMPVIAQPEGFTDETRKTLMGRRVKVNPVNHASRSRFGVTIRSTANNVTAINELRSRISNTLRVGCDVTSSCIAR